MDMDKDKLSDSEAESQSSSQASDETVRPQRAPALWGSSALGRGGAGDAVMTGNAAMKSYFNSMERGTGSSTRNAGASRHGFALVEDEEEDVIPPRSELGKYCASYHPSAVEMGLDTTRGPPPTPMKNFGFVCGRVLPRFDNVMKNYGPSGITAWVMDLLKLTWDFIKRFWLPKIPKLDKDNDESDGQVAKTPVDKSYLYTREYRLFRNARHMGYEGVKLIEAHANIIGLSEWLQSSTMKSSQNQTPTPQEKRLFKSLMEQTDIINDKLKKLNALASAHNIMMSEIGKRYLILEKMGPIVPKHPIKDFSGEKKADFIEPELLGPEMGEFVSGEKDVELENEESKNDFGKDEVYLLQPGSKSAVVPETSSTDDPKMDNEVKVNQCIVLEELVETLKPIRIEMKERESKAFKDQYGRDMDEEKEEAPIPSSSGAIKQGGRDEVKASFKIENEFESSNDPWIATSTQEYEHSEVPSLTNSGATSIDSESFIIVDENASGEAYGDSTETYPDPQFTPSPDIDAALNEIFRNPPPRCGTGEEEEFVG